jgi:hypothetical protein
MEAALTQALANRHRDIRELARVMRELTTRDVHLSNQQVDLGNKQDAEEQRVIANQHAYIAVKQSDFKGPL